MTSSDLPITDITEAVKHPLEELGIHDADALQQVFVRAESQLAAEIAKLQPGDPAGVEAMRVRWLGRKQGIIGSIADNWLSKAPKELKREIGQKLNALRQKAEQEIKLPIRKDVTVHVTGVEMK